MTTEASRWQSSCVCGDSTSTLIGRCIGQILDDTADRYPERDAYGTVLREYDLMVMPTNPFPATPIPARMHLARSTATQPSRCSKILFPSTYRATPRSAIPCGKIAGLPVGMMLVAKQFDEPTLVRTAKAFGQRTACRKLARDNGECLSLRSL
jgi:Asp-tRNA(Asn)/Glu-tRNA(Gln) amidotransferase A subunit family amidase